VVTLVLWLGCVVVGAVGLTVAYTRPESGLPEVAPVEAQLLDVKLTEAVFHAEERDIQSSEPLPALPPALEPMAAPQAMELVRVTKPNPAIAFALPVEGPVRTVAMELASHGPGLIGNARETAATPPLQVIAYGQGEGRQPAPAYPRQAVREKQEGIVTVRFSVGENGRVLAAETVTAAPWPLLNDAALRVVRERWLFRPGPARLFEVAIRFELKR
jgi:TonB family protein